MIRTPRLRFWTSAIAALTLLGCTSSGPGPAGARTAEAMSASREPISAITGDSPNFAQLSDGSMMTVVSRDFGRGAKAGALVELYYPHYATDHLWDAYVGVRTGGEHRWAHQLKLVGQSMAPDSGRVISRFAGEGYSLVIEDLMPQDGGAHLRRATLTNTSDRPIDATIDFYGFFTLNHLPTGDRLRAENGTLLQVDGQTAVAVTAERPADRWHLGSANQPIGAQQDARQAAESGKYNRREAVGPALGGVNGTISHDLGALAPGESAGMTYAIGVAGEEASALMSARRALSKPWGRQVEAEKAHWLKHLARYRQPAMPAEASEVYRRALITLKQLTADNGAIIAAPTNMNPPYRFVWPRDGALIALSLLEAGDAETAKRFFTFCERLQQPTGGFAINYFPDASKPLWDFGRDGNEHDQVGMFAWGVGEVYQATGDAAWARARWGAVAKACDFLLEVQREDGLLGPCRDLWELDHDGTWTYSNGAGVAGLRAGAKLAALMGEPARGARYAQAAKKLEQAIRDQLVVDGALSRGLRKKGLDPTIEAANLALGGAAFKVFPDADPIMRATGAMVESRLASPGGGIRRYEGDRYYDGQPWPVATTWLAMHQLALGDSQAARARFDAMTRYAHQTDARMLGEQFDEGKGRWVSAFPLAWSEAAYVQAAVRLFR